MRFLCPAGALIAGERNPRTLAQLARSSTRRKISVLEEAFTGHFTDHHAFLLARMLAWIDAIDTDIAELDTRIQEMIIPFAAAAERLDEIPGIGRIAAAIIIAEIGTDMTRFPTAAHLASWAKFTPGVKEYAGKKAGVHRPRQRLPGPGPRRSRRKRTHVHRSKPSATKSPSNHQPHPSPAPQRYAGRCRTPANSPIFRLAARCRDAR
jgi:hypothetical protein